MQRNTTSSLRLFVLIFLTLLTPPQIAANFPLFPEPFDSTRSYQLSGSCDSFFKSLVEDSQFIGCHSFAFLLPSSLAFSQLSRAPAQIQGIVDHMCYRTPTPRPRCKVLMGEYASRMKQPGVCSAEMDKKNPFVIQAYVSFRTYDVMQTVGCLRNATGTNCYIDALGAKAGGLSMFYLINGQPLPANTEVLCSDCNQRIMDAYADEGLSDTTLPLLTTYGLAAKRLNAVCGAGFVKVPAIATAVLENSLMPSTASHAFTPWLAVGMLAIALAAIAFP